MLSMPSIYQLKPAFQNLLRPLVKRLFDRGVTANQVTVFAAVISLLVAALVALGYIDAFDDLPTSNQADATNPYFFLLIPVWMFLRMALNAVDGMLAREFRQQSLLGAYLNELCDVIADSALYLSFAVVIGLSNPLLVAFVILALIAEYAGVMAASIGAARRYDGPMGKSDRAALFGLFGVLVALQPWLDQWLYSWFGWASATLSSVNGLLALGGLLLMLTTYNRVKKALYDVTS